MARRALEAAAPELEASVAIVIGVFSRAGATRFANRGMSRLLAGPGGPVGVRARLVAPPFAGLAASAGDPVFQGIMHFGDLATVAHSVRGVVRRLDEDLLVVAEFDVAELERVNAEVSATNSEIANLRRRAELDKRAVERALAELSATQAMLVHAEKMTALGQLTAGLAHEIGNPLAFAASNARTLGDALHDVLGAYGDLERAARSTGDALLGALVEALRRRIDLDFLREDEAELRRATLDGLARVQRIVDGLKRFARLDEAEVQIADVREPVRDALALASPALKEAGADVAVDLAVVPAVRCNPAELCQVFLNLLVNAAHAIAERGGGGGHVRVRTRAEPGRVLVEIEDDGAGMRADVLSRIFDPFFTTKPVGRGTGLGLTIAHKIVADRHGGSITAASTPGAGSVFTVALPAEERP
ncbi:MAG: ATP-binding protein [Minicystis sp.]